MKRQQCMNWAMVRGRDAQQTMLQKEESFKSSTEKMTNGSSRFEESQ